MAHEYNMLTINWLERKVSAKGASYAKASLEDGREVTIFSDFPNFTELRPGSTVEGDLKMSMFKGKQSFTLVPLMKQYVRPSAASKNTSISVAMDKKVESIRQAQENRSEGVKVASTMRDATLLTIETMKQNQDMQIATDIESTKKVWIEWRKWLLDNWDIESQPPF